MSIHPFPTCSLRIYLTVSRNFSNAPGGGSNKPQHIRDSLQDSQGALYELGVCDDGTLVGLLEEELEESLDTLRLMASRLGCAVWVLRKVAVGEVTPEDAARNSSEHYRVGEWDDREDMGRRRGLKSGILWVAEAFVKPIISKEDGEMGAGSYSGTQPENAFVVKEDIIPPATEQLKISLTGTTTSGKSTLLGTLTSSQPDNGRGKSRLGLFRHRHELVSGVTSSVAQEILGYKPYSTQDHRGGEVINYSYGNISSWTDVHTAISNIHAVPDTDRNGRLVLLSDTAGHPRYRRTTIRSLVGWAPHYALLLIPGDEDELSDASRRHLQLVLKLGLRLVVLITKLDIARREGLRHILQEVLLSLRKAGREPQTVSSPEKTFAAWSDKEEKGVRKVIRLIEESDKKTPGAGRKIVPVVFTSSVSGVGIGTLHALLRGLPIPTEQTRTKTPIATGGEGRGGGLVPVEGSSLEEVMGGLGRVKLVAKDAREDVPRTETAGGGSSGGIDPNHPIKTLFHIEEVYALPSTYTFFPEMNTGGPISRTPEGVIVSGHLRYGHISVGDELVVGPFCTRPSEANLGLRGAEMTRSVSTGSLPSKRKDTAELSPSNSSFLLASSAGSFRRKGWLSDEDGTGVSSGDEHHRGEKYRRPRSALAKGTSKNISAASGSGAIEETQQKQQGEEWKVARVVSVRRLRLPVGTLFEGEAGTVGLVFLRAYQPSALETGTVNETKLPEIKVQALVEKNDGDQDEQEGGVSLLCTDNTSGYEDNTGGDVSVPITIADKRSMHNIKDKPGDETPSGTTKAVSFAATMPITIDNGNSDAAAADQVPQGADFRVRKGMVVLNQVLPGSKVEWPKAYSGFVTEFMVDEGDGVGGGKGIPATSLAIGTHVVIYCASIRAAARVVETPGYLAPAVENVGGLELVKREKRIKSPLAEVDVFGFEDEDIGEDVDGEGGEEGAGERRVVVAFEFLGGSEWVEVGAKVFVMSGQRRGLDGVVGRVARVGL